MELRTLRYFVSAAREGSMTKAASLLYVSQPALSRQLRDLEQELGVRLFRRVGRGIELTEEGRVFRQRAEEILDLAARATRDVAALSGEVSGEVHVGGGSCYTAGILARAARALSARHPTIKYHIYDGNSDDFLDRLDQGLMDFCILYQPVDLSKYEHLHLPERESWGLIVRPDSPLAARPAIRLEDLIGEPLILSRQIMRGQRLVPSPLANWIGDRLEQLTVIGTYNLAFNATLFAAEGLGSVVGFEGQIRVNESDRLCFRPFDPPVENECDVAWKRGRLLTPAAQAYLDVLREEIARGGGAAGSCGTAPNVSP